MHPPESFLVPTSDDHPVVADPNFQVTGSYIDGNTIGLPSMNLIAAGGEILYTDTWINESQVQANLP